jgi:Ca2+-binding EF-hand superfamily protein
MQYINIVINAFWRTTMPLMPRTLAATAVVSVLMFANPALAQPSPEQYQKIRNTLVESDSNGDGRVTRREFDQHRAATFQKLDRNADGTVDNRDSPRIRIAQAKFDAAFAQAAQLHDTNFDRRITRYEWDNPRQDVFALVDQDGDGVIVLSELPASL